MSLVCEFHMPRITDINKTLQWTTQNCGPWPAKILFALHTCILIKITATETEKSMTYLSWDAIYRRYDKMNTNNSMSFSLRTLLGCRLRGDDQWWRDAEQRTPGAKIIPFDWLVLESVTITRGALYTAWQFSKYKSFWARTSISYHMNCDLSC